MTSTGNFRVILKYVAGIGYHAHITIKHGPDVHDITIYEFTCDTADERYEHVKAIIEQESERVDAEAVS